MLAAAILGVLVIPMLYVVFQWLREKVSRAPQVPPPKAAKAEVAASGTAP